ncbi:hypothetical protein VST7929_03037 [Vibrio stylophorae]|uniref:Single-stranded DNA-binding protein n=1 Tax=Vibrio stylophorae TaxID=659351 RepID=A0ABM8ZYP4_9VIBR|nr:hypothetical protein [Vibrio stylophorae]CAH0535463.1 hypothetical protein VST7929_03037 [Vibrio stylophorae]
MIVQAQIADIDDIQQRTFTNRDNGEITVSGELNLLTTKPSQVVKVKVSAELWQEAQNGKAFESMLGKQQDFCLATRDYSFVDGRGQHQSGTNITLFKLPEIKAKA